jgi:hypothetical protein
MLRVDSYGGNVSPAGRSGNVSLGLAGAIAARLAERIEHTILKCLIQWIGFMSIRKWNNLFISWKESKPLNWTGRSDSDWHNNAMISIVQVVFKSDSTRNLTPFPESGEILLDGFLRLHWVVTHTWLWTWSCPFTVGWSCLLAFQNSTKAAEIALSLQASKLRTPITRISGSSITNSIRAYGNLLPTKSYCCIVKRLQISARSSL